MLPRQNLVLEFWDRSNLLTVKNSSYRSFLSILMQVLLKSDISGSDITTNSLIKKNKKIKAAIIAKSSGILAGIEEFEFLNSGLKIKSIKNDGNFIKKNDILAEMSGPARKILAMERMSLNLLQRMSGIATAAYGMANATNAKVAATRKTLWGLLDKKAVHVGRGLTHRLDLSDGIIIKDNHLRILEDDIKTALDMCGKNKKAKYIEIEITGKKQAFEAAEKIMELKMKNPRKLFAMMFDNMKPDEIKKIIGEFRKENIYNHVLFEASGGIDESNIAKYGKTGVDVISLGCITHSAKTLDMSMEVL